MALFAADEKFADVVAALEARGWKRLPFVGCPKFDLKWTNYAKIAWTRVAPEQIVNHLRNSILFSQKDQLTRLLYAKAEHKDGDQRILDGCFPRTFDLSQLRDQKLLKNWFIYCEALKVLKTSLSEEEAERSLETALKLAKAVVGDVDFFEKWRTEDVFGELVRVTEAEQLLTSKSGKVSLDFATRQEIEQVLDQLGQQDPQFSAMGDINSNVWICKPSNLSQGRGIVLCMSFEELMEITSPDDVQELQKEGNSKPIKWIVQKYIERPLLLQNGRKFDIRQWVLITELEPNPVVFWFYKSYLRFCSRTFDLSRLHDRFTHLSNYSVQQHFELNKVEDSGFEASSSSRHDEILDDFDPMWSSDTFQDTLRCGFSLPFLLVWF
ncbi:Tubulin monoglycylase TTLL3 [Phytophthora citrophthora]|uniref:Tubulin monoglycylase TTLL3 n=1 Tax=Phytophthora citrophthora TaxID=4793 RepID=A0AAD9GYN6_9STRA|nr:Tubulin monoglycylase TTLL3 [Phytophthora citrophthora]